MRTPPIGTTSPHDEHLNGYAGGRERRSPSLGADLAALFPTMGSLEGRQLISQLGSGPANSDRDTPQPSAASSLDRILCDLSSSDVLQEHKSVPSPPSCHLVQADEVHVQCQEE